MSATLETQLREVPGGQMSAGEVLFCHQVREAIRAALDGRTPFLAVSANLWADLTQIRKSGWDVDAAVAGGLKPSIAGPTVSARAGLSPAERTFLADVDGFLDYALRNGLSFLSVLGMLWHDIAEIAAHGFSLGRAEAEYFLPKASGWAKRNADLLRPSEEETE